MCDIFLNILSNIDKYLEALKKVTEKVNARTHLKWLTLAHMYQIGYDPSS